MNNLISSVYLHWILSTKEYFVDIDTFTFINIHAQYTWIKSTRFPRVTVNKIAYILNTNDSKNVLLHY